MATELHVLAGSVLVETFRLTSGTHLLGSTDAADLLLSTHDAATDVCEVEVSPEGEVTLTAITDEPLHRWDGETGFRLKLRNGDLCEIGNLRLILLRHELPRETHGEDLPATAPSAGTRPPVQQNLALKIVEYGRTRVIRLERPIVTFGRAPSPPPNQSVIFSNAQISRQHARLVIRPDGLWIEDLGGNNGTFLNGSQLAPKASWPLGGRVRFSSASDAPEVELMSHADALAEEGMNEALVPLRGRTARMQEVRAKIVRYATAEEPLLIRGETGTGKELVAQALATLRGAKRSSLHPLNCGAFPEALIEAELFGYRKGAFTGAAQDQKGQWEAAGDGTLFLDEIGELPLSCQPKLLRVLESKELRRLGETTTRETKARVVAATHRDLEKMSQAGTFREDLYHRIAVLEIVLPPLRDRLEDLPDLARFFLGLHEGRSAGKRLSEEALQALLSYRWPGNVRQLRHVVDRAAWDVEDGTDIGAAHLSLPAAVETSDEPALSVRRAAYPIMSAESDRTHCEWALAQTEKNVAAAARLLGMSQSAFRRRLIQHGLLPGSRGGTGEGA